MRFRSTHWAVSSRVAPASRHIRRRIHQQTVAGGGAQGVDDHDLLVGILLLQQLSGGLGIVHRAGLAGGEGNMQQIVLFSCSSKKSRYAATLTWEVWGQLALPSETP